MKYCFTLGPYGKNDTRTLGRRTGLVRISVKILHYQPNRFQRALFFCSHDFKRIRKHICLQLRIHFTCIQTCQLIFGMFLAFTQDKAILEDAFFEETKGRHAKTSYTPFVMFMFLGWSVAGLEAVSSKKRVEVVGTSSGKLYTAERDVYRLGQNSNDKQ